MQTFITSVKEHNARQGSLSMMFQNEDGSLKRSGFVVTKTVNGIDSHEYAKTMSIAESIVSQPKPEIFNRPDSWGTY